MRVQLTGNADDTLIVRLRQSCGAITRGILDGYEGFPIEYVVCFGKVRNDSVKGY